MATLDNIKIPGSLLAGLYKNHLVILDGSDANTSPEKKEEGAPSSTLQHLGGNRRKVLLLTGHTSLAAITADEKKLLDKILEACKMDLEDVVVLPFSHTKPGIETLKKEFEPEKMVLFGVDAAAISLPIRFPEFKLQAYDQTTYLQSCTLAALSENTEESKAMKKKLWACLKNMFQL